VFRKGLLIEVSLRMSNMIARAHIYIYMTTITRKWCV